MRPRPAVRRTSLLRVLGLGLEVLRRHCLGPALRGSRLQLPEGQELARLRHHFGHRYHNHSDIHGYLRRWADGGCIRRGPWTLQPGGIVLRGRGLSLQLGS